MRPCENPEPEDDDSVPPGESCPACGSCDTDESYGYLNLPPRGGYRLMGTYIYCHTCSHGWNEREDYEVNPCTLCEKLAHECSCGVSESGIGR